MASALAEVAARDRVNLLCRGRPELDLTLPDTLTRILRETKPAVVINTAAFTNVDGAEADTAAAFALNRDGVRALWAACQAEDIPLIHLSTDCVFDGALERPYRPDDAAAPLGVYGKSKLAGEAILTNQRALIVRVSWIFSRFGSNFLTTMLRLAQTKDVIRVVNDQYGCPTHAEDLARGLIDIATQVAGPDFGQWGVYHLAGAGETDRATQARAIFAESKALGGPYADVLGVPTSTYPTPAKRPLNARLDCRSTETVFGVRLPQWENRLKDAVSEILTLENTP